MSLINKMNVGNTDYDIQDRLMPDAIGQAGQVLKVKDDGSGLEFSTIKSGGGKLYLHKISVSITGIEGTIYINIINTSNTSLTENEYFRRYLSITPTVASFSGSGGSGAVSIRYIDTLGMYRVEGAVAGDIATGYYLANSGTISSFNDIYIEL